MEVIKWGTSQHSAQFLIIPAMSAFTSVGPSLTWESDHLSSVGFLQQKPGDRYGCWMALYLTTDRNAHSRGEKKFKKKKINITLVPPITPESHKTTLTTLMGWSRQHNPGTHHQLGCPHTMEQELSSTRHPASPHHDLGISLLPTPPTLVSGVFFECT